MNLEKQKENFKNHRATFKDLGNIKILDFKKPNSTEYRIRFLFILSNGYDFLCDKTEVIEAFLTDVLWDFTLETGIGSNGYDKFSEIDGDICDIISDFGKRETGILDLYMLAFKLAKEQLKISKED